jgi:hypothetical protein
LRSLTKLPSLSFINLVEAHVLTLFGGAQHSTSQGARRFGLVKRQFDSGILWQITNFKPTALPCYFRVLRN